MKSHQTHTAHGKVQSFYTKSWFHSHPKNLYTTSLDQSSSSLPPTYMHMITQEKGSKHK
jgi:proteasome lid subunit RPN8/RPN11